MADSNEVRNNLNLSLTVPFATAREAEIAYHALRVDKEPKRSNVTKKLDVKDNVLSATFQAPEARQLRIGINSFMDHLILVTKTIEQFGPPRSEQYSFW